MASVDLIGAKLEAFEMCMKDILRALFIDFSSLSPTLQVPVGFLQVGLVIGQLNRSSDRGFVYDLIPTPPTDGGGPACSLKSEAAGKDDKKKGSKSGKPSAELPASLVVDNDWVAEHARQVKMESFSMYAKKLIGSCCVTSYNGFLYLCF
ncbi:hypothetical protein BHM03_00023454 [Ensete ventricosum]|nr:hypothetical protein BHM03_00023454 [Ensete ventricosum]